MTATKETEKDHAKEQAQMQLESIREMVATLNHAREGGTTEAIEEAEQTIRDDALSIEVRSQWHDPCSNNDFRSGEYRICLCTGGPACQIIGELNEHSEAESARLEYQDWGTPWTDYPVNNADEEILLQYANCFYFRE